MSQDNGQEQFGQMLQMVLPQVQKILSNKDLETRDEREERINSLTKKYNLEREQIDMIDRTLMTMVFSTKEKYKDQVEDKNSAMSQIGNLLTEDVIAENFAQILEEDVGALISFVKYMDAVFEEENIYEDTGTHDVKNVYEELDLK